MTLASVLVTAKGMPDFATRIFLHQLCERSPHLVVVGLADWNPSGVTILLTYKFGSPRLDAHRSAGENVPTNALLRARDTRWKTWLFESTFRVEFLILTVFFCSWASLDIVSRAEVFHV